MNRREFLQSLAGLSLMGAVPSLASAASTPDWRRTLVLIEMQGGNDGLNTVIPFRDTRYRQLRPRLAIPHDRMVTLGDRLALHPSLPGFQGLFEQRELAVIQGVGYPDPNRSHFRSIDIWETGSGSHRTLDKGWLAQLLDRQQLPADLMTGALVIGRDPGPVRNARSPNLILSGAARLLRLRRGVHPEMPASANPALRHIMAVERQTDQALLRLAQTFRRGVVPSVSFPRTRLGRQLEVVSRLLINNIHVPVIKIGFGSFDTHSNQPGRHARLLKQMNDAVTAFRSAMRAAGKWNDVLLMTYSEFGRRARENGSRGTDHGTSAPHFVIGGKVRGGLYGRYPSLGHLQQNDLVMHVDYRSLYHTVSRSWLGMDPGSNLRRFPKIPNLVA